MTNPDDGLYSIQVVVYTCTMSGEKIQAYKMKFIVWIINDIHMGFNDIHWEECLHITRHFNQASRGVKLAFCYHKLSLRKLEY